MTRPNLISKLNDLIQRLSTGRSGATIHKRANVAQGLVGILYQIEVGEPIDQGEISTMIAAAERLAYAESITAAGQMLHLVCEAGF